MLFRLRHRLAHAALLAWMAVFGLFAAPTVSRALAATDPVAYAAICSAAGATDPAAGPAGHVGDACGLCAVAALPLAPAAVQAHLAPPSCAEVAAVGLSLPSRQAVWRLARSRAPPLHT